jgi:hypothetical protein
MRWPPWLPSKRLASNRISSGKTFLPLFMHYSEFIEILLCRIRAKQETYQDESKIKYTIMKMFPIDYIQDTASLLEEIAKYQ